MLLVAESHVKNSNYVACQNRLSEASSYSNIAISPPPLKGEPNQRVFGVNADYDTLRFETREPPRTLDARKKADTCDGGLP